MKLIGCVESAEHGPVYNTVDLRIMCSVHFYRDACMHCGLAMRKQSVCLSNACIDTKRKKALSRFLYHTKDHLA